MCKFNQNEFLERLKELRISKKMSQVDMSRKLGLSINGYRSYETGRTIMPSYISIKLAKELNVSLEYLFYGIDNVKSLEENIINIRNNTFTETKVEDGFLITTTKVPLSQFLSK